MVKCQGRCDNHFHRRCIKISIEEEVSNKWICETCLNNPSEEIEACASPTSEQASQAIERILDTVAPLSLEEQFQQRIREKAQRLASGEASPEPTRVRLPNMNARVGVATSRIVPTLGNLMLNQNLDPRLPIQTRMMPTEALSSDGDSSQDTTISHPRVLNSTENVPSRDATSSQEDAPQGMDAADLPQALEASTCDLNLTEENAEPRPSTSTATRKKTTKGTSKRRKDNDPPFVIKEIVSHITHSENVYEYRVRFEGFHSRDDLWYFEKDLKECWDKLKEYKLKHRLGEPIIPRLMGSSKLRLNNVNNWQPIEKIMEVIKGYVTEEQRRSIKIGILEYPDQLDQRSDKVYLICHGHHVFTGLFYATERRLIIADGENSYSSDSQTRKLLNNWLRIPIRQVDFSHQNRSDHCASTAAIIAIKMIQLYSGGKEIGDTLVAPKTQHEAIKRAFHKEPSELLSELTIENRIPRYNCDFPGCTYYSKKRCQRQLNMHRISKHPLSK